MVFKHHLKTILFSIPNMLASNKIGKIHNVHEENGMIAKTH